MQIVLDFDRTITGQTEEGKGAPPMIAFLRNSNILGEEYKTEAQANFEYYYKFEIDHELDHQEKVKLMHEWWVKHLEMLAHFRLTKKHIHEIANSLDLVPRKGVIELLKFANTNNIPVIIFSAGILGSESIKIFLERFKINFSNVIVIINELIFDENGLVIDFKEPIIHSENKNESILKIENIKQRKNTILVGDSLSDAKMVLDGKFENRDEEKIVYRIGITNSKDQKETDKYINAGFDMIADNFLDIVVELEK